MNVVLGDILPFAVTIAISPVPIIAVILMLMSPRPRPLGLGFLVGWVLGIAIAVTVFTLLSGVLPEKGESLEPQPILGSIQLLLGIALVALAVKQWGSRPKPGEDAKLPAWMAAIDAMKPPAAMGMAALLAGVNPKNLLMAAAAGVAVGHSSLAGGSQLTVVLLFILLSSLSVLAPVLLFLVAPAKAGKILDGVRVWLTANNATIMVVVLAVLGVVLLGKGISSF